MASTLDRGSKVRLIHDLDDGQDGREETYLDEKINVELDVICNYAGIKGNKTRVTNSIKAITELVTENGLDDDCIEKILDLLLKGGLDEINCKKLVKLLLPRKRVQEVHVVLILGNLFTAKKSVAALLLKWVILIYDILESTEKLRKLYGVIFYYLKYQTLSFKIAKVSNNCGTFQTGSLPFTVLSDSPRTRQTVPNTTTCPDLTWQQSIQRVQDKWNKKLELVNAPHAPLQLGSAVRLSGEAGTETKRRKLNQVDIPTLRTSNVEPMQIFYDSQQKSVTIEELSSLKDLAHYIDRLELPNQLASVLENRLLQHFVVCNPEDGREPHPLGGTTPEGMAVNGVYKGYNLEKYRILLQKISEFGQEQYIHLVSILQELFPVFEIFLDSYVRSWDGVEHQEEIFKLISFVRPTSYEGALTNRFNFQSKLILTYTEWLKNWSLHDWGGHDTRRRQQQGPEAPEEDQLEGMFAGLSFKVDYYKTMHEFTLHVDRICVMGLELEKDDVSIQHATLSFFELVSVHTGVTTMMMVISRVNGVEHVSAMSLEYNIPEIIIPSFPIVHRCFFSVSGMAMSRIVVLLVLSRVSRLQLDAVHTKLKARSAMLFPAKGKLTPHISHGLVREVVEQLNKICEERRDNMSYLFSLTHSAATASLSSGFIKELEATATALVRKHVGPVTSHSLKENVQAGGHRIGYSDYRVQYLDFLKDRGFVGVYTFLYSSMTSLMGRKVQSK
ncbi:hypothetical protein BC937DRAFT_88271 [Endogone sp. FLAS-F59071]|nr:hypothetical protein BC937DRAFT_88271 [Endogone sp. FLAS-F59071]|eukprot:RUS18846.1 hypothetical protein BC937DRAFT_88271 [Endogone sp. FLAS-F59071]